MSKLLHERRPGRIQLFTGNLLLPGEDLPQSNFGLERPHYVSAQCAVRNTFDRIRRTNERSQRGIVKRRELRKQKILVLIFLKVRCQHLQSVSIKFSLRGPFAVQLGEEQEHPERSALAIHSREGKHCLQDLVRTIPLSRMLTPLPH